LEAGLGKEEAARVRCLNCRGVQESQVYRRVAKILSVSAKLNSWQVPIHN